MKKSPAHKKRGMVFYSLALVIPTQRKQPKQSVSKILPNWPGKCLKQPVTFHPSVQPFHLHRHPEKNLPDLLARAD